MISVDQPKVNFHLLTLLDESFWLFFGVAYFLTLVIWYEYLFLRFPALNTLTEGQELLSKGRRSGHVIWQGRDAIITLGQRCATAALSPLSIGRVTLSRRSRACRGVCLDPTPLTLAILVSPPEVDRPIALSLTFSWQIGLDFRCAGLDRIWRLLFTAGNHKLDQHHRFRSSSFHPRLSS